MSFHPGGSPESPRKTADQTPISPDSLPEAPKPKRKFDWFGIPKLLKRKPKETTPLQKQNANLDTMVSADQSGQMHIDKTALGKMTEHAQEEIREGFYNPEEQTTITSSSFAKAALDELERQSVRDSQDAPVTEYIRPDDPRYKDPSIPDYLKIGTDAFILRQAQGGNYYDVDEVREALRKIEKPQEPIEVVQGDTLQYEQALKEAMRRLLEVKPEFSNSLPDPEKQIDFAAFAAALKTTWTNTIPLETAEDTLSSLHNATTFSMELLLMQFASGRPGEFRDFLAAIMGAGDEGYTVAQTLTASAYDITLPGYDAQTKILHPEQYKTPLLKDIPPALFIIVNNKLPVALIEGVLRENSREDNFTFTDIFSHMSDRERNAVLQLLPNDALFRLAAWELNHPQGKKEIEKREN